MSWLNPSTWQVTNTLQGQAGGLNAATVGKAIGYANPLTTIPTAILDLTGSPSSAYGTYRAPSNGAASNGSNIKTGDAGTGTTGNTTGGTTTRRTTTTSGGSGGAAPADLSVYDQGIGNINAGLGRLQNQENIGLQNVDSSYNTLLNQLTQARNTGEQTYNTNKNQNTQDYVTSKNTIGANAGASVNSLQRLLGARGAGGSSAALFSAPQAVAQQAAQQRAGVGQTFGRNQAGLDTGWNNYLQGYNSSLTDAERQRNDNQNSVHAKVATNRAQLLQSLATLTGQRAAAAGGNAVTAAQPYIDQANSYLGQADNLALQAPVYSVQPTSYSAPSLDSYTTNQFAAPEASANALTDQLTPYLSLLLGKNRQQQPQF